MSSRQGIKLAAGHRTFYILRCDTAVRSNRIRNAVMVWSIGFYAAQNKNEVGLHSPPTYLLPIPTNGKEGW
ncbi:hypothetical protein EVAR_65278_1 [Eumeta japonica]|uniref:Uncharacterized protein n=1 Tax=Eumeta variegata TaxID=151549 RepID=A0A4C1ZRR0_EUMVA|nr:hypothetical protein EVAR_65278_1 [Eumeta japonica]